MFTTTKKAGELKVGDVLDGILRVGIAVVDSATGNVKLIFDYFPGIKSRGKNEVCRFLYPALLYAPDHSFEVLTP